MDKIEVTQADREAAWNYRPSCYKVDDYTDWMAGKYDMAAAVIFGFARHRLATRTDATPDHVAALVEAAKAVLPSKLCGESWGLPDAESVQIVTSFGKLNALRQALAPFTKGQNDDAVR